MTNKDTKELVIALKQHNHHFKRPKDKHGNLSCLLCILESKAHKRGMENATEIEDCLKVEAEARHEDELTQARKEQLRFSLPSAKG
jgi:hypothetical protein